MTTSRPAARPARTAPLAVLRMSALSVGAGVAWQQWLQRQVPAEAVVQPVLTHWLTAAAFALPVALLTATAVSEGYGRLARRAGGTDGARSLVTATAALVGLVVSLVLAGLTALAGAGASAGALGHHVLTVLPVTVAAAGLAGLPWAALRGVRPGRRAAVQLAVAGMLAPSAVLATGATAAAGPAGPCPTGARTITYDLAAFQNVIPLNGWGDRIPDGLQYALRGEDARVGKDDIAANPALSAPMVVRANVGDCIVLSLRNDISDRRIGLHADGLVQFDPATSDGARVGRNPDSTVLPGREATYTWYADRVGEAPVLDIANLDDSAPGGSTVQLGLYGGVVVHPRGSTWHDPITGADLLQGGRAVQNALFADIRVPDAPDFRSYAMVFMDETEDVADATGAAPSNPRTGLEEATFGVNYRSEPLRNRVRAIEEFRAGRAVTLPSGRTFDPALVADPDPAVAAANHFCDGFVPELGRVVDDPGASCVGEEAYLQSWVFGDEGKLTRVLPGTPAETPAAETPAAEAPVAEAPAAEAPAAEAPATEAPATEAPATEAPATEAPAAEAPATDAPADEAAGDVPVSAAIVGNARDRLFPDEEEHGEPADSVPGPTPARPGDVVVTDSDNLVPKAYVGDPVRFHVIHPGASETHPWHQHTQRWLADPDSPTAADSPRKDVQSVSPGEAFPLELEGGAGGAQRTAGDTIFHCHLYPHFAEGFWGHLRVFDRLRDGTQTYPDGTPIEALQPLVDRDPVPAATAEQPGFPLFVKGEMGQRAYRPPFAVVADTFAGVRRPGDAPRAPTALEAANLPALDPAKPGAAMVDPCPTTAALRTYRPHVVDAPIVYNDNGWADRQGRLYVEESHKAAVLAGTREPEPYTIRARLGECVQVLTTNDTHLDEDASRPVDTANRFDGQFQSASPTTEVSTHVHLVKFDQLGSDGTSVGWNYVQAAMPGQTYGYRWYVDTALRTVFFHDHQYAALHQQKGLFGAMNVEPADATWHDPATGAATDGVGTVADIHSPSGPDFREITVFHQDRIPMWKGGPGGPGTGQAVQPPSDVDDAGADQGGYALNYRNAPFQTRTSAAKSGLARDPAYVYSSVVHGDPSTPVFRAYTGDPVVIRNVDGSHEEVHTFNLHGHRWMSEPDNDRSTLIDNQTLSLAEYFNYELSSGKPKRFRASRAVTEAKAGAGRENGVPEIVAGGAGRPGDYLYGSTPLDDQWLGMWGIFRVPQTLVSDLKPLPDATGTPRVAGNPWPAVRPGKTYTSTTSRSLDMCPASAPVRQYDVTALTMPIRYAETGEHDPFGALYVPTADVAAVRTGRQAAEPLVLRANAGDCVKVTLRNGLPRTGLPGDHSQDVPLPADVPDFPRGARVSLHASLVDADVTRSDGAAVGYNRDSTVGPGRSMAYTWYVPPALDGATVNLVDFGDRRGHRHHGLFGALLVEPAGSTWTHPQTGAPAPHGASAVVRAPDTTFREHTLQWQDGLTLFDASSYALHPTTEVDDRYDLGSRGVNYRTARFAPRLAKAGVPDVFSSDVHGDPDTGVMRAYAGESVRIRLAQGSDRGRARTVVVSGHAWNSLPGDPGSRMTSSEGRLLTGQARTIDVVAGARRGDGGRFAGDYLVRDASTANQVEAGLWTLLRVHGTQQQDLAPLPRPLGG